MLGDKDKRKSIRIPLLDEGALVEFPYPDSRSFPGTKMRDITPEGVFFIVQDPKSLPQPKAIINITIQLPGDLGTLPVLGQVVRLEWTPTKKNDRKLGYGVQFITGQQTQKILDAYVVYLRNKQIIAVSKRIIEEFFGPKGPPNGI